MTVPDPFALLFAFLPRIRAEHAPDSPFHAYLRSTIRGAVEEHFSCPEPAAQPFGPFGELVFPYHEMGAVNSLNLMDPDELILFSFYWANRDRYTRALDLGANLGLHSIVLNRCGFTVQAYEPDPTHFALLERNLERNGSGDVTPHRAAVSTEVGEAEFTRVLGNTTGSHLSGCKPNPYGELERFTVPVVRFTDLLASADLAKIDVEGKEKDILLSTTAADWEDTDALVEVSNPDNAAALFAHFAGTRVNLFAQKISWERVRDPEQMPFSYKDGTLFISTKDEMPWPR